MLHLHTPQVSDRKQVTQFVYVVGAKPTIFIVQISLNRQKTIDISVSYFSFTLYI